MIILLAALTLGPSNIPLIEAGQRSAPECIEYCATAMLYQGIEIDVYRDCTGYWRVGLSMIV